MFETETVGPFLVLEVEVGEGHGPPGRPIGYAPVLIDLLSVVTYQNICIL